MVMTRRSRNERIIYSVNCDRLARPARWYVFVCTMIERPAVDSRQQRSLAVAQGQSIQIRRHRAPGLLLGEESTHACMAADAASVHMHGVGVASLLTPAWACGCGCGLLWAGWRSVVGWKTTGPCPQRLVGGLLALALALASASSSLQQ